MNMCPGEWVMTRGRPAETAARVVVTPQAQNRGFHPGEW